MQTAILILLIILIICVLITLIFTLKNSSKPSDSGLEQRINGSVKMFSDIISENQQVIGKLYADKPFCTNGQRNQKVCVKVWKNTLPICTKRFRRYIRTFIRCK